MESTLGPWETLRFVVWLFPRSGRTKKKRFILEQMRQLSLKPEHLVSHCNGILLDGVLEKLEFSLECPWKVFEFLLQLLLNAKRGTIKIGFHPPSLLFNSAIFPCMYKFRRELFLFLFFCSFAEEKRVWTLKEALPCAVLFYSLECNRGFLILS